jgi:excisionase family DNA binding protein
MYTIQEVADELKLSYQKVYRMIQEGEIGAKQFGNAWRVPADELKRLKTIEPRPIPQVNAIEA